MITESSANNAKQLPGWNDAAKLISKEILDMIKLSENILLHCHPSPDPDSLGSTLAMKMVLENMGKKVTAISGDSKPPQAFLHMPGFDTLTLKNVFEVDLSQFDIFIVEDSGAPEMISKLGPVVFPDSLKVINIDHHATNTCFGKLNLVIPSLPATCALLTLVFREWGIRINSDIARCLLWGIYTDTGGFKYSGVSTQVFEQAAYLMAVAPEVAGYFTKDIATMECSNSVDGLYVTGLGLSKTSISVHEIQTKNGQMVKVAISLISNEALKSLGAIDEEYVSTHMIIGLLRSVRDFDLVIVGIEKEPLNFKSSLRSKGDLDAGAVAKLISPNAGGGHKGAAGATIILQNIEAKSSEEVLSLTREKIKSAVESYLCSKD